MSNTSETPFPSSSSSADAGAGTPAAVGPNGAPLGGNEMFARVVQGAHQTVDRLAETAAPHVQRLTEGVGQASETLSARADQVRDVGDEWAESLRTTVRENPLAAIATALVVGVLIARLTS
jgi:ElaB/YqjD/DUF883 family membrane-anchored ribosome-binding protein